MSREPSAGPRDATTSPPHARSVPALAGLRVLDLTDESGRLAGKLLAEAGADVLRLSPGATGAPMRGDAAQRGGTLDWWFDAGVRRAPCDLDDEAGRSALRSLAARADLFLEGEPPGRLAALALDFDDLRRANPRLVHVSLTPFGRTGPRAGWQASDLVASALGGVLAVTGTPDEPLNGFGRQSFQIGGFYAALVGLAAVHAARRTGAGQHVDVSLQQCVLSCTEHLLMYWYFPAAFPGGLAGRQGSLHWTGLYEVMRCAAGYAMLTPAPTPEPLFRWMDDAGMLGTLADSPPVTPAALYARAAEVMAHLRAFAATRTAQDLFLEGQRRHLPIGQVCGLAAVAASAQCEARGFLRTTQDEGPSVRMPGPLFRLTDGAAAAPAAPPAAPVDVQAALASWPARTSRGAAAPTATDSPVDKPLSGLRILDFTQVVAGPMATRALGDLGADVIKLQTEERSRGTAGNEHPFFTMWNRSKRGACLNMKHAGAPAVIRRLVERVDVVMENFAPGVLERWGVGFEAMREWNPRLIYVGLSGCGRDGPWRDFVTYAPTIHALCGLTSLTNPAGRSDVGHGISISDHVSGLAGALAVLEALEVRRRTGRGQLVDLSQLEVGLYLLGPSLVDLLNNGREAQAAGNRDGLEDLVPNEVYRCADGEWLAVTARSDEEWEKLCTAIGDAALARDELRQVEGRRQARAEIDRRLAAWAASREAEPAAALLQECGVPAGKVQNAGDIALRDPQLAARDCLIELEHASLGRQQIDRFPAQFSAMRLEPYRASPAYGEHSFEVYGELLGMSEEEIALAIADGLFV